MRIALIVTAAFLLAIPLAGARAQTVTPTPPFSITVDNVVPPVKCSAGGWYMAYDRTTSTSLDHATTARYIVQYVDGDLISARWLDRQSNYVQDSWITAGAQTSKSVTGDYAPRQWTDSYEGVTDEYVVQGDDVLWKISAAVTCAHGEVVEWALTSEPFPTTRDRLPVFEHNLVLALEDIPIYRSPNTQKGYLGTIQACQTFFVGAYWSNRASDLIWVHEYLTDHDLILFDGSHWQPIVDVAEDYGQPEGQPILDQCVVTPEAS